MIKFDSSYITNRRKVILKGRIVTVIDLAGYSARIAEDGKWHHMKDFFPLTEEHIRDEHIEDINRHVRGRSIATIKPNGTGVQLVFDDNTRLLVKYDHAEGIVFGIIDSDENKVL